MLLLIHLVQEHLHDLICNDIHFVVFGDGLPEHVNRLLGDFMQLSVGISVLLIRGIALFIPLRSGLNFCLGLWGLLLIVKVANCLIDLLELERFC